MKKTLTLPESEIITLANAAKEHGTVELAKTIGIGKSQLYRILRGHNRVTPVTADKINAWLSTGIPKPEKRPASPTSPTKSESKYRLTRLQLESKSRKLAISQLRNFVIDWDDPDFLQLAARKLAEAIQQGRLKNVTIVLGGYCKCGD